MRPKSLLVLRLPTVALNSLLVRCLPPIFVFFGQETMIFGKLAKSSLYSSLFLENFAAEAGHGELHLQSIDSRIRDRKTGVRNVNVLQSNADISVRA